MARVKGGPKALKRRKNILSRTKGFRFGRSTKKRQAKEALLKAGTYAFRDRKNKKRVMRSLSIVKLNAALRQSGFKNYSTFINTLKKAEIELNRTVLAQMAETQPEAFERFLASVKK
jgi:large subunit ribosomal protein L20